MFEKIKRQVEQLEESMGKGDGAPPFDFELVFVEAIDGRPSGRVERVKLSELKNATSKNE